MKKIAIHHHPGSFSDQWIAYCEKKNIPYKIINAYNTNIIQELFDCNVFMWHHQHAIYKDVTAAKKILFSLEHADFKVFPNFKTNWHFDDKIAQKYLLEAIGAPLVPSYVFYDKQDATCWAKKTNYPKVFKLKGGSGSANVRLVKSKNEALKLINKAFGKGFPPFSQISGFIDRLKKFKAKQESFIYVLKGLVRIFIKPEYTKQQVNEKGYVYFQDFIPNNKTDFRIKVVDQKCWGFQRKIRHNDFRASGSNMFIYDNKAIPREMLKISLEVSEKLGLQSVAFDFVISEKGNPLIVEISYGFGIDENEFNNGYWDKELNWHSDSFLPQEWMIDAILNETEPTNKI